MIKVVIAPLPNHSRNQSITHNIIKGRRQPTPGKLMKESFSSLDTIDVLRSSLKGTVPVNLSNHYKISNKLSVITNKFIFLF